MTVSIYTEELLYPNDIRKIEKSYYKLSKSKDLTFKAAKNLYHFVRSLDYKYLMKIKIFIGPGNNGLDAIHLSYFLIKDKYNISIHLDDKSKSKHKQIIKKLNLYKYIVNNISCDDSTLIIDGLFGIGLNRKLVNPHNKVIREYNKRDKERSFLLSIDIPSGINSNNGEANYPLSNLFCADLVYSFIKLQPGLFMRAGSSTWKKIINNTLVTKRHLFSAASEELISLYSIVPFHTLGIESNSSAKPNNIKVSYNPENHKTSFGRTLIIGGTYGYFGAILLAGQAALKCGSRYVEIVSNKKHSSLISIHQNELISSYYSATTFLDKLIKIKNIVIGPGLSSNKWSSEIFSNFSKYLSSHDNIKNIVVDAGALRLLSAQPFYNESWILTPHPGEAAMLLDTTIDLVQSDRLRAASLLQKKYGGMVVLKGPGTIIKTATKTFICSHGNAGMGTAGMGDCLSGIIISIVSLFPKNKKIEAVLFAVGIHSFVADTIFDEKGYIGMLASDIIDRASLIVNSKIK